MAASASSAGVSPADAAASRAGAWEGELVRPSPSRSEGAGRPHISRPEAIATRADRALHEGADRRVNHHQ
jgi:hypothetical protein